MQTIVEENRKVKGLPMPPTLQDEETEVIEQTEEISTEEEDTKFGILLKIVPKINGIPRFRYKLKNKGQIKHIMFTAVSSQVLVLLADYSDEELVFDVRPITKITQEINVRVFLHINF